MDPESERKRWERRDREETREERNAPPKPEMIEFLKKAFAPTPDEIERRRADREAHEKWLARKPRCPACGGAMTLRVASRGRYDGKRFWGCNKYFPPKGKPRCRGIVPYED